MDYEAWVKAIGVGFHPDTCGADYVPRLSAGEVADYDAAVDAEFASGRDPYARAIEILEREGLLPSSRDGE